MNKEIWKDIKDYENLYQVSNFGNIKSLKRNTAKEKILKPLLQENGYYAVTLCKKGKRKLKNIHRIVAETFLNNIDNLPQVNHKDGNKLNNYISNLEFCTAQYNTRHSLENNLRKIKIGGEHKLAKKVNQYTLDDIFIKTWGSMQDIHKELGYSTGNISRCCKNTLEQTNGYKWRYANEN